jgi:hypothetical protein
MPGWWEEAPAPRFLPRVSPLRRRAFSRRAQAALRLRQSLSTSASRKAEAIVAELGINHMKREVFEKNHWRDSREKERAALLDFFSRIHPDQRHRGQDSLSPLRALDQMLRGPRPGCASLVCAPLSGEDGQVARADLESAFSGAFEMLTRYVGAAQRTGELMDGDSTSIASLLLCVAIGGMQRMGEPVGRQDEEALPAVLLRLLASRRSHSDQARSMNP